MSSTSSLVILGLASALMLSCKERNPAYCDGHPEDVDCRGDGGIGPATCTSNTQCTQTTPVCDTTRSMCVQCTAAEASACRDAAPVCGVDDTCRSCAADTECASMTCLPDGACVAPGSVLYAAPAPAGGATANCTPTAACTLARAVELIDATRSTIRLDAGRYDVAGSLTLGTSMRIVGRGAVIDRNAGGTGATLIIADGAIVALDYVTVEGGDGDTTGFGIGCTTATLIGREISVEANAAAGINSVGCSTTLLHARIATNQGPGIAASGGSLTISRSLVIANQSGGLVVTGAPFELRNNAIVKNGSPTSAFGGVLVSQITTRGTHVFEFNTVAQNQATEGSTPGVICSVVATPLTFGNDIVFGNATGTQVEGGNCAWRFSDIGPVPLVGTGDLNLDPQFVAPAQNNFHLQASSPLRDAADPTATVADDIDDDARPQGGGRDVGADEIN
jgi:hypothetical protein